MVNKVAELIAAESNGAATADAVKASFGIATPGTHSFTTTVTPTAPAAGQAKVTVTLTTSGSKVSYTKTELVAAIKAATGFGTSTTNVAVNLNSTLLGAEITFAAGANDQDIKDAIDT